MSCLNYIMMTQHSYIVIFSHHLVPGEMYRFSGEYVTLYQTQRSLLRERSQEKDDYIAALARDRENMQDKLGQLQAAVMQLLTERNILHSYDNSGIDGCYDNSGTGGCYDNMGMY